MPAKRPSPTNSGRPASKPTRTAGPRQTTRSAKPAKPSKPHPSMLDDDVLMKDCTVGFGRTGGPGGQHRNKVDTAVAITHTPSGIIGTASERREQHVNRSVALRRLRVKLAVEIRRNIHRDLYEPSELWKSRRQGKQMSVSHKHHDYPALLAEALDVIVARGCDVAGAAGVLGVSMSQLGKLIRHNKHAFTKVNEGRVARGLKALRK